MGGTTDREHSRSPFVVTLGKPTDSRHCQTAQLDDATRVGAKQAARRTNQLLVFQRSVVAADHSHDLSHSATTQPTLASDNAEHLSGVSWVVCQYEKFRPGAE